MYNIIGISRFGKEIIDTADSRLEAIRLVNEYRIAFGIEWIIQYKRK
tara:strand:- start:282 stop:422 length:141 start_codon:yes stop_codon:yes gene_type:complete